MTDNENIIGAGGGKGGGGGGGRTAVIASDTLSSNSVVKVLFAIGEGEMGGLVTTDARSIRFNNTPLMNNGGSFNYNNVTWAINVGTPDQSYIPGFSTTETYFPVSPAVQLTNSNAYTLTTSGPNIDAVRVDVVFPALSNTNTSNGDVTGTEVDLSLYKKKLSDATWVLDQNVVINDKSSSPVTLSYLVDNPSGQGTPSDAIAVDPYASGDPYFYSVTLLMHFNGTNGSTTFTDSSTYSTSCTVNAGVPALSNVQSKFGSSSLHCPPSSTAPGSVRITNSSNRFIFDADFTIECWAYREPQSWNTYGCLARKDYTGATGYWLLRIAPDGKYHFDSSGSGSGCALTSTTSYSVYDNQWVHLCVCRKGTTITLYVNGVAEATATATGIIGSTSATVDGGPMQISEGAGQEYWTGYIDEFRITKGVARYSSNFTVPAFAFSDHAPIVGNPDMYFANVVAMCHFNDLSNPTLMTDYSPNSRSISAAGSYNSSTTTPITIPVSTPVGPKFGAGCLELGVGGRISLGSSNDYIFPGDFTVEAWIYQSLKSVNVILMSGITAATAMIALHPQAVGWRTVGIFSGGAWQTVPLPDFYNRWAHFACVRSSGTVTMYLDGTSLGSFTNNASLSFTSGSIGGNSSYTSYYYSMDEFRATKGVARYTSNFTPVEAPFPDSNSSSWAPWNVAATPVSSGGGGSGETWQVQVRRNTADNGSTYLLNSTFISGYTEIQDVAMSYPNTCVLGIRASAKDIGNSIPTVSGDWYGRLVKVPSNYNPTTRAYTGSWNGSFSSVKQYSNNPAWVLYDMLTETRAGLGVDETTIDKFSFYDASVHNDELLSNGSSGTEPRYTFNGYISQRLSSWDALSQIAATMHGRLITTGQIIKLVQDRPSSPIALITNSNVISDSDNDFTYSTPSKTTRFNACKVTLNDPAYSYQVKDVIYNDTSTGEPYLQHDVNGFGITSEGQARRLAKWYVYTSLYDSLTCSFKLGPEFATLEPFDVIKIMDTNISGAMLEARVVSKSGSTVTLDRPVIIGSGTWTLDAVGADGVSIETRTITSTNTTSATLTLSAAITGATNSAVIITGTVLPQTYRILSIKEGKDHEYEVTCIQYSATKYSNIENGTGTSVAMSSFISTPDLRTVTPVTGFVFNQVSVLQADGSVQRYLDCDWAPLASDYVVSYIVSWRKDSGSVHDEGATYQPRIRIPISVDGTYQIFVIAVNAMGKSSTPATASYSAAISAPVSTSTLPNVTGLQTVDGSTTAWLGSDLKTKWTVGTNTTTSILKDYVVQYADASTSVVFKTAYTTDTNHVLSYADNSASNSGSPKRNIKVTVKERDTSNSMSSGTTITLSNVAPSVPSNIAVAALVLSNVISWTPAASTAGVAGYMVWGSTTSGFTPSSTNLLFAGGVSSFTHTSLTAGDTWYYKIAAYDSWGHGSDATGLNASSQYSGVVIAAAVTETFIASGTTSATYTVTIPSGQTRQLTILGSVQGHAQTGGSSGTNTAILTANMTINATVVKTAVVTSVTNVGDASGAPVLYSSGTAPLNYTQSYAGPASIVILVDSTNTGTDVNSTAVADATDIVIISAAK
jgi:hypothetical protein